MPLVFSRRVPIPPPNVHLCRPILNYEKMFAFATTSLTVVGLAAVVASTAHAQTTITGDGQALEIAPPSSTSG